jgi:hypothetical protein
MENEEKGKSGVAIWRRQMLQDRDWKTEIKWSSEKRGEEMFGKG